MAKPDKTYTEPDLNGLKFIISNLQQHLHGIKGSGNVFKIGDITYSEVKVTWDGCTLPASYTIRWALHYLNEGIWIECK